MLGGWGSGLMFWNPDLPVPSSAGKSGARRAGGEGEARLASFREGEGTPGKGARTRPLLPGPGPPGGAKSYGGGLEIDTPGRRMPGRGDPVKARSSAWPGSSTLSSGNGGA